MGVIIAIVLRPSFLAGSVISRIVENTEKMRAS